MAKFGKSALQLQKELNHAMPIFGDVKFGDMLVAILASINALITPEAVLTNAGLAIKAGGSAIVKSVNAILAVVNGVFIRHAASDMAALVGTLATAKSAAWAFYIDGSGTLTTSAKTADAATHDAALALLPVPPVGLAQIGILVLDNATGAPFIGGTTALDTASLTATYYNTQGAFPATATLGDLTSF
ncbi:MAG: hypothetical protein JWL86_502 [Rhizobium sp.]|nr:hypothetical protein [Rhizobium sp.]